MTEIEAYNRGLLNRAKSGRYQDSIVGIDGDGRFVTYPESMFGTDPKTGECSGTPSRPLTNQERKYYGLPKRSGV